MLTTPRPEQIDSLIRARQVREFLPDPVPDDALRDILEVARWTGSAMNRQPWRFIVVRDPDARRRLADAAPNAQHVANAPVVIVIVMPGESAEMDAFDEARAAERILVAAYARGLGAGLGWVTAAGRPAVRELLGVPDERRVRTLIAIGYPTEQARRPKSAPGEARRPLRELVAYERWDTPDPPPGS